MVACMALLSGCTESTIVKPTSETVVEDPNFETQENVEIDWTQVSTDAEDMFNSFANGADAGTFSVDKLGDAVKEFGIRVKDESDSTMQAFKDIGLNADETAAAFAAGGEQAAKAFDDVTTALFAMDDPLAQNAAGVALFGTMWEDLGVEGMEALTNLNGEISTTTDALSKINAVKYDDFGSAMSGLGRVLKTNFVLPIGEEALPALSDFVNELSAGAAFQRWRQFPKCPTLRDSPLRD